MQVKMRTEGSVQSHTRTVTHQQRQRMLWVYGVLSVVLVPALTLFIGLQDSPFEAAMSRIGFRPGMFPYFFAWTVLLCGSLYYMITGILTVTGNAKSRIRITVLIGCAMLLLANLIPFMPEEYPFLAHIHENIAIVASFFLMFNLLMVTLSLRKEYARLFKRALVLCILLFTVSLSLFYVYFSNSITEIVATIGGCGYLFVLMIWVSKTVDEG